MMGLNTLSSIDLNSLGPDTIKENDIPLFGFKQCDWTESFE